MLLLDVAHMLVGPADSLVDGQDRNKQLVAYPKVFLTSRPSFMISGMASP